MNREVLSIMLLRFTTHRLRAVYQAFDGDLTMALVLCEIASRNTENIYSEHPVQNHSLERRLLGCNALSISEVTGIPRETVRRKLAKLVEHGWIERNEDDAYVITEKAAKVFGAFDCSQVSDLISTSDKISRILNIKH